MKFSLYAVAFFATLGLLSTKGMSFAAEDCDPFTVALTTSPVPPQSVSGLKKWSEIRPNTESAPDIMMLGDSLAEGWPKDSALKGHDWQFLNLGVGRDRTQNTLWRLDNFDVKLVKPSKIVVMVGTNNLNDPDPTACSIAIGTAAVTKKAKEIWPSAEIYLYSIPPRGLDFKYIDQVRAETNELLKSWSQSQPGVHFIGLDENEFTCGIHGQPPMNPPNSCVANLPCEFYRKDNVHISAKGYQYLSALLPW